MADDGIKLTKDERSEIGLAVQEGDTSGVFVYVESIVAARVQALTAERDELREEVQKELALRGHQVHRAEKAEAELAAANTRIAELEDERIKHLCDIDTLKSGIEDYQHTNEVIQQELRAALGDDT